MTLSPAPNAIPATREISSSSVPPEARGAISWAGEQEPFGAAERLTPREYEIVRLLALGWTWKRIIGELHIARDTLRHHRQSALRKYEATCLPELWAELGWLQVPA